MDTLVANPNTPITKPLTQRGYERCNLFLEVATDLFIQHGYEYVSLDQIVEVAGGSKATIYKYFGSKQGLFFAICQKRCDNFLEKIDAICQQDGVNIRQDLSKLLFDLYQLFLDKKGAAFGRLMMQTVQTDAQLAQKLYDIGVKRAINLLADYLQKAHDLKQIHCKNPTISATYLLGFFHDIHWRSLVNLPTDYAETEICEHIDYMVERFIQGHQCPSA